MINEPRSEQNLMRLWMFVPSGGVALHLTRLQSWPTLILNVPVYYLVKMAMLIGHITPLSVTFFRIMQRQ